MGERFTEKKFSSLYKPVNSPSEGYTSGVVSRYIGKSLVQQIIDFVEKPERADMGRNLKIQIVNRDIPV